MESIIRARNRHARHRNMKPSHGRKGQRPIPGLKNIRNLHVSYRRDKSKSPATAPLQYIPRRMHQVLLAGMATRGSQARISILALCVNGIHQFLQADIPLQGQVQLSHCVHHNFGVVLETSYIGHQIENLLPLPVRKSGSIYSFNSQ